LHHRLALSRSLDDGVEQEKQRDQRRRCECTGDQTLVTDARDNQARHDERGPEKPMAEETWDRARLAVKDIAYGRR
jgi:hypothetical protein